jgi:hypothetical protein
VTYATAQALRTALEHRLGMYSQDSGVALDRLRRRVVFERIVARLEAAEPARWVVKGGMALEVRLRDDARLTKDLDLGLREPELDPEKLRERLIDALGEDPDDDRFVMTVGPVKRSIEDGQGHTTWRVSISADLAGKLFGGIRVDVSPRAHELDATDVVALPNSLAFAGIAPTEIEIIDVHQHAAEKLHAMQKDFGDRENTRVRDLVDVIILHEHDLLDLDALAHAVRRVWEQREEATPPRSLPPFPASWPDRYEDAAAELGLETLLFTAATSIVAALWDDVVARKDSLA